VALIGSFPGWVLTVGGFALYDVIPSDAKVPFWIRDTAFNLAVLTAMLVSMRDRIGRSGRIGGAAT
jgi:alpha-1,6-mannosyltransferase